MSVTAYISYSHLDDPSRSKLEAHLMRLKHQNLLGGWTYRKVTDDKECNAAIDQALETAPLVLLLVSAHFLASEYSNEKELVRAMERHNTGSTRVVPIILSECDWHSAIYGEVSALPKDCVSIDKHPRGENAAFTAIAEALQTIAEDICRERSVPSTAIALKVTGAPPSVISTGPTADQVESTSQSPANTFPLPRAEVSSAPPPPSRTLKIQAIKFWGLEVGPFEVKWQIQFGRLSRISAIGASTLVVLTLFGIHQIVLNPMLNSVRDSMRLGQYADAQRHLDKCPTWLSWWPQHQSLAEQVRFGVKLIEGENIEDLEPELARMRARYPDAPDVAVFDGLLAYWKEDIPGAITHFNSAMALDPRHTEAHFLAAGRHAELARKLAIVKELAAHEALSKAQALLDTASTVSPTAAVTHRKYANQRVELFVLRGEYPRAYGEYRRLASRDALSALLAAVMSWHLPDSSKQLRESAAAVRTLLAKELDDRAEASDEEQVGWKFDVSTTRDEVEVVLLTDRADKRCFAEWILVISQSIIAARESQATVNVRLGPEADPSGRRTAPGATLANPDSCKKAWKVDAMRDALCSKLLSAVQALPIEDAARGVLGAWTQVHPRCNPDVSAAAVLRPRAPS